MKTRFFLITAVILIIGKIPAAMGSPAQVRLNRDIEAGNPIVIQICVALADNEHQWIVPVPASLGNGQNTRTNLYWGARYGLKTFMLKDGGWKKAASLKPKDTRILERLVLTKSFHRKGRKVKVYLVADAWDGNYIKDTIKQFLDYNAGHDAFSVQLKIKKIKAGGGAHLIAYIGHNALMDYWGAANLALANPRVAQENPENDAIVLACKSKPYFSERLREVEAHPLVLTTGLMAPEAYSLHSAINQWVSGADDIQIRKAAAASYAKYQKTGRKAAERLFGAR